MKDFARIHLATAAVTLACAVACGGTSTGGATKGTGGSGGQGGASSIPPSPPAQAAVAITISAGATGACSVAGGQITTPPDTPGNLGAVYSSLTCSLANPGCAPDTHVVMQGDPGADVRCSVTPNGASFDVQVSVMSGARMSFQAHGQVTTNGGTLAVYEFDHSTQRTLEDPACNVVIVPNLGTVKKGAIWARFECANFTDPNDIGGSSCAAAGSFIFENCGG